MLWRNLTAFATVLLISLGIFTTNIFAWGAADTPVAGIDVSVYQGDIDFTKVKSSGISMVYIRAGEGDDWTDSFFEANARKVKDANLDFGFYYYVTATSTEQAAQQASRFVDLIKGKEYTMRPVMDYEQLGGVSAALANEIALTFLQEVESLLQIKPVFYTDAYRARTLWDSRLGAYPLWIADYTTANEPEKNDIWSTWSGWQYSDEGRVDGINARVDLDHFTSALLLTDDETALRPDASHDTSEKYTVVKGNTLYGLMRKYDVSVTAWVKRNGIKNPNLIYVNQVLAIPTAGEVTGTIRHIVQRGETLWYLSRSYDVPLDTLVKANNIANPNLIYVGQTLQIPVL